MMKLEHVAIWTRNLEGMRAFYEKYFGGIANKKYTSTKDFGDEFHSYFLSFDGDARLELMELGRIPPGDSANGNETLGLTHFSFSLRTKDEVDELYAVCKNDGVKIAGEPRMTGDGFYEACILDPDGNRVEFAVLPK